MTAAAYQDTTTPVELIGDGACIALDSLTVALWALGLA